MQKETERLESLQNQIVKSESDLESLKEKTKVRKTMKRNFDEIEDIGKTTFFGKVEMTKDECTYLKEQAKKSIIQENQISRLKDDLATARRGSDIWRSRYEALYEQTKEFIAALRRSPEIVIEFIRRILQPEKSVPHIRHKTRDNSRER